MARLDAPLAARIPGLPRIVAFRNPFIQGYAKPGHMPKSAQNNKLLHCNKMWTFERTGVGCGVQAALPGAK